MHRRVATIQQTLFTVFMQHKRALVLISFSVMIFRSLMASIDRRGNHLIIQLSALPNVLIRRLREYDLFLLPRFISPRHKDRLDNLAERLVADCWPFSLSHCFLERIEWDWLSNYPRASAYILVVRTFMRTLFRRRLRMYGAGVAPRALPCAAPRPRRCVACV